MPRPLWKGAISFGLVNAPVALFPASQENGIDFDWIDKRTMDPVGYKRINKRSGKEIEKENIVKGVKQQNGEYVILSDEEIEAAYPKTTRTIEIEAFVEAQDVAIVHFEKPYYLAPDGRGSEKVYALLRQAMLQTRVMGIARIVMHTKEHLAALIATEDALMLDTLRWGSEIRGVEELNLPASGNTAVKLKETELKMAAQLIRSMSAEWRPEAYSDRFIDSIHQLIARKVKGGNTYSVEALEATPGAGTSNVIDLAELLKNSLGHRKAASKPAEATVSKRIPASKSRSGKGS
jgi:DNA end-binding protein Ku